MNNQLSRRKSASRAVFYNLIDSYQTVHKNYIELRFYKNELASIYEILFIPFLIILGLIYFFDFDQEYFDFQDAFEVFCFQTASYILYQAFRWKEILRIRESVQQMKNLLEKSDFHISFKVNAPFTLKSISDDFEKGISRRGTLVSLIDPVCSIKELESDERTLSKGRIDFKFYDYIFKPGVI